MRNSFARLSAFVFPRDFFDEIIPADGMEVGEWRIYTHNMDIPVEERNGTHRLNQATRLVAEIDFDEAQLDGFDKEKLPEFEQIIRSLIGFRSLHLPGNVNFNLFSQDFVKDGISRNMHPIRIEIGVRLRLLSVEIDGVKTYDSEESRIEKARNDEKQAAAELADAKEELKVKSARYACLLSEKYFRRAFESYGLALKARTRNLAQLYDIRDAIQEKFGKEEIARRELNLKKSGLEQIRRYLQ